MQSSWLLHYRPLRKKKTHRHICGGPWNINSFLRLFPSQCRTFFSKGLHCALRHESCSVLWQEKCCAVLNVIKHAPLPWSPDIERLVEEGLKIQHPLWVGLGVTCAVLGVSRIVLCVSCVVCGVCCSVLVCPRLCVWAVLLCWVSFIVFYCVSVM